MARRVAVAKPRFTLFHLGLAVIAFIGVVVVLFPIMWMVVASMRPGVETLTYPPIFLPQTISWTGYEALFTDPVQRSYLVNTYIIAIATAALSITLGSLAAYGFSRFRLRGANIMLIGILALQMLPGATLIIPYYNFAQGLGIHNTYTVLVLINTAFALPISIWLLKNYIDGIPSDLEEAAMVDGCNRMEALLRVIMPITLPGLVGTATFAFLSAWSEFVITVVLTSGPGVAPLTIAISRFFSQYGRDWQGLMALSTATSLPLLVVFVILQRWVVQGMTAGAVK